MIIRHISSLFIAVLVISVGCEKTDRARFNPLDPLNTTTGGRPQGLQAVAGHERVLLSWADLAIDAVTGYRLRRQENGGNETIVDLAERPLSATFIDSTVVNGQTYTYRLSVFIQESEGGVIQESPASVPVEVTPGPDICWIADEGLTQILTMTSDIRAVGRQITSIFGAKHLAVDPRNGAAWTTTQFGGTDGAVAVRFSSKGVIDRTVTGFTFPASVVVDPRDGAIWIADIGATLGKESSVSRFSQNGGLHFKITGFSEPSGLAVNPNTGACWVADRGNNTLHLIGDDGTILLNFNGPGQPTAVSVDPATGDAWGINAATQQVFKIRSDGTISLTVSGFIQPVRLACSALDGSCWVVDAGGSQVIRLRASTPDGYHIVQQRDFHLSLTDFFVPVDVSIDQISGQVWIVDKGEGSVVKIAANGSIIRRFVALVLPVALAVDAGPR
jgi:DNA-binding beta-propeller fold protein YncE